MNVFESVTLPLGERPDGDSWYLVKVVDEGRSRLWRRSGPVLAALDGLVEWVCAHVPLDGPEGVSELLRQAREAIDQAIADEIDHA